MIRWFGCDTRSIMLARPKRWPRRARSDLNRDRQLELSLIRLMKIVGEAAARTPDSFRQAYPAIEWREISDLRNRRIHAYDAVDLDILWKIISDELPLLIARCEEILADREQA